MPIATDTLTTHIIAIPSWWETYCQRLLFLLDINQLDYTAGWWVHFSIWIRFSLYAVHVVLINQNSNHITIIFLYWTLIYCCHSWLLHKDAATQFTDQHQPCSILHAYHFISVYGCEVSLLLCLYLQMYTFGRIGIDVELLCNWCWH